MIISLNFGGCIFTWLVIFYCLGTNGRGGGEGAQGWSKISNFQKKDIVINVIKIRERDKENDETRPVGALFLQLI